MTSGCSPRWKTTKKLNYPWNFVKMILVYRGVSGKGYFVQKEKKRDRSDPEQSVQGLW
jgi:hypothetical protein